MSSKRILILTNRIPYPLNDGGNMAMHAMITGYHKMGWEVYLLSMNTSRHYITQDVLETIYKDIAGFETVDIDNDVKSLPTIINYLFSSKPNHAGRFYKKAFADKLEDVINKFMPDAIQVESVFLTGYLPLIRKLTQAVTILRLHNIEYQVWHRLAGETRSLPRRAYLKSLAERIERYELSAWAQYDLLLPITDTDASVVRAAGITTQMLTVPFGIDITKEVTGVEEQWVGYHIGAMDWLPNEEAIKWFLHDVWPELVKVLPDFSFYYAGRNMPGYFKGLDTKGVHCMGEVPDATAFIADKKILIVPLRSGGGIRIKILEAMAAGKIIVSTATGVQGIDAIDGVHYLQAEDVAGFVEKISWILANKAVAEDIGKASKVLVQEKYDAAKLLSKVNNKVIGMLK